MGSKRRSSDIISLLVSIYGSKDIFIDEYKAVLADRLLQQLNYNTARSDCEWVAVMGVWMEPVVEGIKV